MTVVQNDIVQSPNQYNIMMGEIFQCKPLLVEECQNGKLYMFDLQRASGETMETWTRHSDSLDMETKNVWAVSIRNI